MNEERKRILEMLQQGKIDVEGAERLLEALAASYGAEPKARPEPAADTGQDWQKFGNDMNKLGSGMGEMGRGLAEQIKGIVTEVLGGIGKRGLPKRANYAYTKLTVGYLTSMQDGTAFTNYGSVEVAPDVPKELLAQKIAQYGNFGSTSGTAAQIGVLLDKCFSNFGSFKETDDNTQPGTKSGGKLFDLGIRKSCAGETVLFQADADQLARWPEVALRCPAGDLEIRSSDTDALRIIACRPTGAPEIPLPVAAEDTEYHLAIAERPELIQGYTFRLELPDRKLRLLASTGQGDIYAHNGMAELVLETGQGDIAVRNWQGMTNLQAGGGGDITCQDVRGDLQAKTLGGDVALTDIAGAVTVESAGGDVQLNDIAGGAKITTAGGDLLVHEIAGAVTATTGGGDVKLIDVPGDVRLSTSGGDVEASQIAGAASVTSSGGDAALRDVAGDARLDTSGGDAEVAEIGGTASVTTGGGDAKITNVAGDVRLSTNGGDAEISDVGGSVSYDAGGGSVQINNAAAALRLNDDESV